MSLGAEARAIHAETALRHLLEALDSGKALEVAHAVNRARDLLKHLPAASDTEVPHFIVEGPFQSPGDAGRWRVSTSGTPSSLHALMRRASVSRDRWVGVQVKGRQVSGGGYYQVSEDQFARVRRVLAMVAPTTVNDIIRDEAEREQS